MKKKMKKTFYVCKASKHYRQGMLYNQQQIQISLIGFSLNIDMNHEYVIITGTV